MKKERQKYTRDFKIEAVRLTQEPGRSVVSVARDLGIHANTLTKWRGEYTEHGNDAFPGKGNLHSKDEEIRQLKRRLVDVTEERDILKKAIAVFSKRPKQSSDL